MNPTMLVAALAAIWPVPREMASRPALVVRAPVVVRVDASLKRPAVLLRSELARWFGTAATAAGGTRVRLRLDPRLAHAEEYAVDASASGVELRAHDEQGAFWAVHTLAQWLDDAGVRRTPRGWSVPALHVRDRPESTERAFMIQGPWSSDADSLKRNLLLLARMKVRRFALEFGPRVRLDFDPTIARGAVLTKAQAREIVDYGRSLGMEPIGYLNLLGHLDRAYEKAPYTAHSGLMIQDDATYDRFIYPILREVLEVYGPVRYFHCGMDEANDLSAWLASQGQDVPALVARHIERIDGFLRQHGARLVIWDDMFIEPELAKRLGIAIGPMNGGAPYNTYRALDRLPKDVVLDYWQYDVTDRYPVIDYLRGKGFTVWASPWQTPASLVQAANRAGVASMGTLWSGPPGCFYSNAFCPVTALYASAAWRSGAGPAGTDASPRANATASTEAVLWRREICTFPGRTAILIAAGIGRPRRIAWPTEDRSVVQVAGIPFDLRSPFELPALPAKPIDLTRRPATALLPGGARLAIDGFNRGRGEGELIVYAAPQTSTGTNIYGAEVAVSRRGRIVRVFTDSQGDMPIPDGGYVLSAHWSDKNDKASALAAAAVGQPVVLLDAAGTPIAGPGAGVSTEEVRRALGDRKWSAAVGARCGTVFIACQTPESAVAGRPLGRIVVRYAGGATEMVPLATGVNSLSPEPADLPQTFRHDVWLAHGTPGRFIVTEWRNPHPSTPIESLAFEPDAAVLEAGLRILGITCAQSGK